MTGDKKRIKVIQKNEITDLKILLNTTQDVDEFLKNLKKKDSRLK